MDAPRYFARRYFAGRFWPPATDAPVGYISGSIQGVATASGRLSAVGQDDEASNFIGRPQRRKRREEKDLRDLYAIVNRMMQEAA